MEENFTQVEIFETQIWAERKIFFGPILLGFHQFAHVQCKKICWGHKKVVSGNQAYTWGELRSVCTKLEPASNKDRFSLWVMTPETAL